QLQPFSSQTEFELHETRDVAARPRQSCNETRSHGIDGLRKDNWYCPGDALRVLNACTRDNQHVGRQRYEFVYALPVSIDLSNRPALIYPQVAADDPAQSLKTLLQ